MDESGLGRFLKAQQDSYERAMDELRAGRKRSHWMWYIFPQLRGLGRSEMAWRYGIADLAEARAYRAHAVLGPRLVAAAALVTANPASSALSIFGTPDDLKFHSCMTLFAEAAADEVFSAALTRYFGGVPDAGTLELLANPPGA